MRLNPIKNTYLSITGKVANGAVDTNSHFPSPSNVFKKQNVCREVYSNTGGSRIDALHLCGRVMVIRLVKVSLFKLVLHSFDVTYVVEYA